MTNKPVFLSSCYEYEEVRDDEKFAERDRGGHRDRRAQREPSHGPPPRAFTLADGRGARYRRQHGKANIAFNVAGILKRLESTRFGKDRESASESQSYSGPQEYQQWTIR